MAVTVSVLAAERLLYEVVYSPSGKVHVSYSVSEHALIIGNIESPRGATYENTIEALRCYRDITTGWNHSLEHGRLVIWFKAEVEIEDVLDIVFAANE